jgi:hypothetical protein
MVGCGHGSRRRSLRRAGAARGLVATALAIAWLLAGPGASYGGVLYNDLPPEVIGRGQVGERLLCASGSWSEVPAFEYEWIRGGITVAAGPNYYVRSADEGASIWCVVKAKFGSEQLTAQSANSVFIPGEAHQSPKAITPPEISGTPALGNTLDCSTGAWTGKPSSFTYQWVRDYGLPDESVSAPSAATTHLVEEEDEGYSLSCEVTAANAYGHGSALSENSLTVPGSAPHQVSSVRVLAGHEPARVGESVSCSPGTWSGHPPPVFSYRWLRNGEPVAGAGGASYTLRTADQRSSLSCVVTASNSQGSAEATSANVVEVAGSAPVNVEPPSVSPASARVGDTLSCSPGLWSGVPEPSLSALWVRDRGQPDALGVGSGGAYVASAEDRGHSLSCEVTASNSEGSAVEASANSVVIPAEEPGGAAPENQEPPVISGGNAVADVLTCTEGVWSATPAPTLEYEWRRDGARIAAAAANRYTIEEADQGHTLACEVIASNSEGSASATSAPLAIPGEAPAALEAPRVTGARTVGAELTCLPGLWSGAPRPTLTYQWLRDGANIANATSASHVVVNEDRGESITCRVFAQNTLATAEADSSNSIEIPGIAPQPPRSGPEVSGIAAVGGRLVCSPGAWNAAPQPTFKYEWLLEGDEIPGASDSAYTVAGADRGLEIACEVTAENREGSASATSASLRIMGVPPSTVSAPQVTGAASVGQMLTCERGLWNGQPPPEFSYKWIRDGAAIPAASASTYTTELADQGHTLSCAVIAANGEGTAEAASANSITIPPAPARIEAGRSELTFPPAQEPIPAPTAAEMLGRLRGELEHSQHKARLSRVRASRVFAFSFTAPAAGTLRYAWYQTTRAASHTSRSRARSHATRSHVVPLATATVSYSTATTQTVRLRLTGAGRRALAKTKQLALSVRAQFVPVHQPPVNWSERVTLSH